MASQPESVVIRPAHASEASMLAAFAASVFVETFGPANTAENMSVYVQDSFSADRMQREINEAASAVLIAERGGEIVGYARLAEQGDGASERGGIELVRMYVDSVHHGAGVADALMDACVEEGRARGHDTMWLGVWEHNPRAQRFYERRGFVRVGAHDFMLGDDRQTDWIMERAI